MTTLTDCKKLQAPATKLFSTDEKTYGKEYREHLIEQYKVCVEMADKSFERRSNSNVFYLTIISALVTIIGVLSQIDKPVGNIYFWWAALVSFSGVVFCLLWKSSIECFRQLSEAKFKVINEIEKRLPAAAFATEWDYLNCGNKKTKYPQLTLVERRIPFLFLILFLALLTIFLISANFDLIAKVL